MLVRWALVIVLACLVFGLLLDICHVAYVMLTGQPVNLHLALDTLGIVGSLWAAEEVLEWR